MYTDNKQQKNEIKKTIPFIISWKIIKNLGINLTNELKDLYTGKYKMLLKEIKENTNKLKDIPCTWLKDLNFLRCQCCYQRNLEIQYNA